MICGESTKSAEEIDNLGLAVGGEFGRRYRRTR